ncbi:MAG: glycosyltransferase [Alistipes sp.]|nr:glycosyltransferase [Alistipes sp.]
MLYFDFFIDHYGWQGAALAAVIVILFAVQTYYYAVVYARIPKYRNDRRPRRTETDTPAISVVVPLFGESGEFIESSLPRLLAQDYAAYEIVVVYVGLDTDFYDDLSRMKSIFPNLRTTKIEARPRYPISPKMAINIGIKSARNEHIILTTIDASPCTSRWLALMAKGFTRGEIVLGYCGFEPRKSLLDKYIRTDRMMMSAEWLSAAVKGHPYRGDRNNIGFTKSLYFGVNGFGNLNMNIGEDDLFMQQIMTRDNVSVVMSPRASVTERRWGGLKWWICRRRFLSSTRQLYTRAARNGTNREQGSRLLFFASVIAAMAVMPLEYKLAAAAVTVIRYGIVAATVSRIGKRLGERGITAAYPIYDVLSPLFGIITEIMLIRKDPAVWRYTTIS